MALIIALIYRVYIKSLGEGRRKREDQISTQPTYDPSHFLILFFISTATKRSQAGIWSRSCLTIINNGTTLPLNRSVGGVGEYDNSSIRDILTLHTWIYDSQGSR